MEPEPKLGWLRFTLRRQLMLMLAAIISLILVGQTLLALSAEVTDLEYRVVSEGTILAQSIASACSGSIAGDDPARFDRIISRTEQNVDVVDLAIYNRNGIVVGHSDPNRVGEFDPSAEGGSFHAVQPERGLGRLFEDKLRYTVEVPILRGTTVVGHVDLTFLSDEIAKRASMMILSAGGMALIWFAIAAAAGSFYLRHITRPLAELTKAATAISEDRLDEAKIGEARLSDEVGLLQTSFAHLLGALRGERSENARLLGRLQDLNVSLQQRVDEMTADLRAKQEYLLAVILCMEDGVITCDQDGRIVAANTGASEQLVGLGIPAPGVPIADILPDGEELANAVKAAIAVGKRSRMVIARSCEVGPWRHWRPVDAASVDRKRTLTLRVYPLRRSGDASPGAVVVVRDETEERLMEARLRRQDRFISLGTMAAGLAHELGHYMHTIGGYATVLLRALPDDDPRRADAVSVCTENRHAADLLEGFLQFARPSQGLYGLHSVADIVGDVVDMCGLRIRDVGVQVEVVAQEGEDCSVCCDARLLMQAFVNVVLNALDAMEGCDERRLTIRCRSDDPESVMVQIEDTGGGIAPGQLERIFDPFFTTKDTSGTGLGLSITHKIVEQHGGSIRVRSELGVGTFFAIVLPRSGPREIDT